MATLILAAAGKAIGGALFGGAGALLGQAAGAIAGFALDQRLFGASRIVEGRRLDELAVQSSVEGAPLPMVHGRVRLAGQVIWATRFEEEVREERSGGKGGGGSGTTLRSYRYFASFAVALCAGPVSHVGAVWADGKPMDMTGITWRVHKGEAGQPPDPLIAALQGETPAYRHTAYVVFERLPLEAFGDRLPQLTFEVIRAIEPLETLVRAVTVIPGAGEFVYEPAPVTWSVRPGVSESANRQVAHAPSNWAASIDELQALCPGLERVALVVAWFGDDLRAGHCTIRPKVETRGRQTQGAVWGVSGLTGASAQEVSRHAGVPAYGGTPSDASVIAAIADLKARGLEVALYPFLLMDVPPGNGLPDPHGGAEQAAHPWRGRITAEIAPGLPGSSEGTAAAAVEIAAFAGSAEPAHFLPQASGVLYLGPAEWSYRRFVLHHANLAAAAGGVDAFLVGSEMRGLTRLSDAPGRYPFVEVLRQLAGEARAILPGAKITYAADWSEYGAHQPAPGELRFPLDPLWADPAIDAVGIDAYFPLADRREENDPDGEIDPHALGPLAAAVAGGEDFDWYYASEADRRAGTRTPISDGAHGKPWVYRAKDIAGWWENAHVERVGGVETGTATDWIPRSKPVWLTELGVPAISFGANQPNVFFDAKSSESAWPRFSDGGRDDLLQRRALEAVIGHWSGAHPDVAPGHNPVSPLYGGPMVDPAHVFLWAWDARPYPFFPGQTDLWADGANWRAGHWLNGRLGGLTLAGLVRRLAAEFGLPGDVLDCAGLTGTLDGIAIAGPVRLRDVLAPLVEAHGGVAVDRGTELALLPGWRPPGPLLDATAIIAGTDERATVAVTRAQDADLPVEVRLAARDPLREHRRYVVSARRPAGQGRRVEEIDLGAGLDPALAAGLAERLLLRRWSEREEVRFALPPGSIALEPGDVARLAADPLTGVGVPTDLRIDAVEEGDTRRVVARSVRRPQPARARIAGGEARPRSVTAVAGRADALILDLPPMPGDEAPQQPRVAAFVTPWPGAIQVHRAGEGAPQALAARIGKPALTGTLVEDLAPGPVSVWDRAGTLEIEVTGGTLSAVSQDAVLAGANVLAIVAPDGGIEIVQFAQAQLVGPRRYALAMLLRGQQGTEEAAARPTPAGSRAVLVDDALAPLPLTLDEIGLAFTHALVPAGHPLDSPARTDIVHTARARGLMPFAPVHARAERRSEGETRFTWIRRTRIGGDGWREGEVPLGEEREAYLAELLDGSGIVLLARETAAPELLVTAAEELAAFGAPQTAFRLRVRQISAVIGPGLPGEFELVI
jgi:hypothetical protein